MARIQSLESADCAVIDDAQWQDRQSLTVVLATCDILPAALSSLLEKSRHRDTMSAIE